MRSARYRKYLTVWIWSWTITYKYDTSYSPALFGTIRPRKAQYPVNYRNTTSSGYRFAKHPPKVTPKDLRKGDKPEPDWMTGLRNGWASHGTTQKPPAR